MSPMKDESQEHLNHLRARLVARAKRLTGDADLAQDLAQEAMLKLWQAECRGARIEDSGAYGMTTLRNLVSSNWRGRKVFEPLEDTSAITAPCDAARLELDRTCAAIDRLPRNQAALLRCVAAGDTSPKDIAHRLGVPEGTVMSRLARARARLRRDLHLPKQHAMRDLL